MSYNCHYFSQRNDKTSRKTMARVHMMIRLFFFLVVGELLCLTSEVVYSTEKANDASAWSLKELG